MGESVLLLFTGFLSIAKKWLAQGSRKSGCRKNAHPIQLITEPTQMPK
jgi:hypothetical protein